MKHTMCSLPVFVTLVGVYLYVALMLVGYVDIRGDGMLPFLLIVEDTVVRSKLEQIYIKYGKLAYWTAYKILNDHHEAEDVLQDAIIKIADIIEKIEDVNCNKTRALIVIIVRNLSINIYNRRKKIVHTYSDEIEVVSEDFSLDEEMIRLEQVKWIAGILRELNPSYGDVLVLRYYYDYSDIEISNLLGVSHANVRVRLHRVRASAKKLIEKEGFNGGAK